MKSIKKVRRIFIITAVLISSFSAIAYASYIYWVNLNDYTVAAESEFYFTSDLLTENETPTFYITHDWATNAAIEFSLRNYENLLNISDNNIHYTVDTSISGLDRSGIIYPEEAVGQNVYIELDVPAPSNINEPVTVVVTASAISPYNKNLHAIFIISPAITYSVSNNANQPVAKLNFTLPPSETKDRTINITWAAGAVPDMTNSLVKNATSINLTNRTLTTTLNTAATYELVFFKESVSSNYTSITAGGV